MTLRIEAFLLGVVVTTTITAAVFFLKFWRKTRDQLFLAFAAAFFMEGCNRFAALFSETPNEREPWSYVVRMISFLLIVWAIIRKNYSGR